MTTDSDELTEEFIIPIDSLPSGVPGIIYVSFLRTNPSSFASCSFSNTVKFITKEVDPTTNEPEETGFEDEYQIEDIEVGAGDYISPTYCDYQREWDRLRSGSEAKETFELTEIKTLKGESGLVQLVEIKHTTSNSQQPLALL
jgi:coatomer subunit gamma